jgi:folate-dependent phosphoribosylglycinamide formyltransferase PurN
MKIIMLVGRGQSSRFIYNALKSEFIIEKVIIENKASKKKLIESRIKKLGFLKVINQLLFQLVISNFLGIISHKRKKELKQNYHLSGNSIEKHKLEMVSSVNDIDCMRTIKQLNPDIIIVNGTRIISKDILGCTSALFINIHVGITPEYRGVHGAYWSLVNKDVGNCGVTIHKVDKGIDTGDIIFQSKINFTEKDNFSTYPLHQYGVAIPLLKRAINDYNNNDLKSFKKNNVKSNLFYHPTFIGYIYNRLFNGAK